MIDTPDLALTTAEYEVVLRRSSAQTARWQKLCYVSGDLSVFRQKNAASHFIGQTIFNKTEVKIERPQPASNTHALLKNKCLSGNPETLLNP